MKENNLENKMTAEKKYNNSPLPWTKATWSSGHIVDGLGDSVCQFFSREDDEFDNHKANMDFILAAANGLPNLLQEIESLKKKLADNEEKFSDMNAELHARQVRIDELMGNDLAKKIAALQRYDIIGSGEGDFAGCIDRNKDDEGDWVKWDDIEELLSPYPQENPK